MKLNRLKQLFKKLGFNQDNGLYYLDSASIWLHKFPYRISRVLRDVIKPYAFFCPSQSNSTINYEHPAPLNSPFILFFDKPDIETRQKIPKRSFNFSKAPIVVINDDNEVLSFYHGYDFEEESREHLKKIDLGDELNLHIIKLLTGQTWKILYDQYFKTSRKIDEYLLKNITDARRILIADDGGNLSPQTANKLIGRLLFIRYLIDRDVRFKKQDLIIGDNKADRQASFLDLLKNRDKVYKFFDYLVKNFNGDLFPVIDSEKNVTTYHINIMFYLFSCSDFFEQDGKYNNYFVQQSLFNFYDFEVIPVELISNIYENFIGKGNKQQENENRNERLANRQKEVKAYYTPPFLVDYILSQTVEPFLEKQKAASCKVLDPSCGSGIFLVETTRKLIEKEMNINPQSGKAGKEYIPNEKLWEIVHNNIFGIDIDDDAIEITIFSLYITLLDYKTPIEIEDFQFKPLKNRNLFSGPEADFFNEKHPFNKKFTDEIELDFIFGNPPWGEVKKSCYIDYIKNRNKKELQKNKKNNIKLMIGNNEISQAFLVRTSDFIQPEQNTKCVFIVTSKNLYKPTRPNKIWRNYFLSKFNITQVFELSSVNNKITGGKQIFEGARQPAIIISFFPAKMNQDTGKNIIKHITVRPNRFFRYFKTIVIEKHDVKKILQKYFIETKGGNDWLWKVLLHGNILDFHFIKRLDSEFKTFKNYMQKYKLDFKSGLMPVDNDVKPENRKDTSHLKDWDYLEINDRRNKVFQPFFVSPIIKWKNKLDQLIKEKKIEKDEKVARLPDLYFLDGKKLLLKNGLNHDFNACAAFYTKNIIFTKSVCSIKPCKGTNFSQEIIKYLQSLVGLFNSNLFAYYVFNKGSSAGVERTRANFIDFFIFPTVINNDIAELAMQIQQKYKELNKKIFHGEKISLEKQIQDFKNELEQKIIAAYGITDLEKSLIDYAINIAIPVLKREEDKNNIDIFNPFRFNVQTDQKYLKEYANIFINHFGKRFNSNEKCFIVDIYVTNEFIGIHFKITEKVNNVGPINFISTDVEQVLNTIGDLGLYNISKDLYMQQDIRGFKKSSFYIIKPNERKLWHKAVAYADLSEFIDALIKSEIKKQRQNA